MGFSFDVSVPVFTVFLQGLVSFFSPCVFPLIPIYISYLSGGTARKTEDGKVVYQRSKVIIHTLFFVIGVSFAFFALGFGFSALGGFFKSNQLLFARLGGAIVFLFGLYQLGALGSSDVLGKERRLPLNLDKLAMSPFTALLMGFTFSFAWTPCVGPVLASVLLMTASASTTTMGFVLIGVYTLGFVLPFLAVGLFTTTLLELFKKHKGVVKYTVKIGGILMMIMGVMMFTGKMNSVTGYLSDLSTQPVAQESKAPESGAAGKETEAGTQAAEEKAGAESGAETQAAENKAAENESGTGTRSADEAKPEKESGSADGGETAKAGETAAQPDGEAKADGAKDAGESQPADVADAENEETGSGLPAAIDFTLTDQYGNSHTLSDYKGKTVFLNFWATWCPPCRAEMPDIQKLYEEYDTEGDDALIVLGIASPNIGGEKSEEGVKQFLEENGYTYPVLMDTTGEQFMNYGVFSYPTTFMIDRDGNVFGYVSGSLSGDMMKSIVEQTMSGKRN